MKTKKLTTCAILIALGTVLAAFPVLRLPNDGSVTLASMVPVILISLLYGTKQGLLSAFAFSLLQMLTAGVAAPPVENFWYYTLVVLLDYVFAFTVLGTSNIFFTIFKKKNWAIPISGVIVLLLRFVCHYLSGILIWGVYAPEGQSPALYSLLYNGSYMSIEIIITGLVLSFLIPYINKKISR